MEEIKDVEVEEESVEEAPVDEELSDELIEEEPLEEEIRPVYAEDVKEMVFRRRSEISDLSEKLAKHTEKVEEEMTKKQSEIKLLDRIAETLPERPEISPELPFGVSPAEPAHVPVQEDDVRVVDGVPVEGTIPINPGDTFYSQDGKLIKGTPPGSPAPDPAGEVDTLEAAGVLPIEDEDPEGE